MELQHIELRDEFYQQVHSMRPRWWMHYGILSVFVVLFIMLNLAHFVKYPDVISANFELTTSKPSITLPLPPGSQIAQIFKNNQEWVDAGSHLLVIENNSNYWDVISLQQAIRHFVFERDSILEFFHRYSSKNWQLGSLLENEWIAFSNSILGYYKIEELALYRSQIDLLEKELDGQIQLRDYYSTLLLADQEQKTLLDQQMKTDSTLYLEGVISKMNLNNSRQNYLKSGKALHQNKLALKQIELDIIRLNNAIANYRKNEAESLLDHQMGMRKSLNRIRSALALWEKNYVLKAPVSGRLSLIQNLNEGDFFEGNAMVIIPGNNNFHANINIPLVGAGKIEIGQSVILKLNDYPYREYGVLEGKVIDLSPIAGENFYLGKIELGKKKNQDVLDRMNLKENMRGIAEVITKDRSFLGRLFEKVFYVLNR